MVVCFVPAGNQLTNSSLATLVLMVLLQLNPIVMHSSQCSFRKMCSFGRSIVYILIWLTNKREIEQNDALDRREEGEREKRKRYASGIGQTNNSKASASRISNSVWLFLLLLRGVGLEQHRRGKEHITHIHSHWVAVLASSLADNLRACQQAGQPGSQPSDCSSRRRCFIMSLRGNLFFVLIYNLKNRSHSQCCAVHIEHHQQQHQHHWQK